MPDDAHTLFTPRSFTRMFMEEREFTFSFLMKGKAMQIVSEVMTRNVMFVSPQESL
ncbi:MAG: hypothetical protein JWQ00_2391, partial [Noviherbaspirillum sp.]|nr:hypothetical protein [Noviherbaspirillum sp.]